MSSLTNFAVSIYVVRALGATQFGAFSLAYVTYAFALNASRGLATDPLMVRFSGTDIATWRRAVADCTGTAAAVGLVAAVGVLAASAFLHSTAQAAFVALGLTLPGLLLQDSWRYSFFALGRGSQAFLNDTIWALALLPGLVLLQVTHHGDVFWYVFVWGAAACVAAAAGPLQARVFPRLVGPKAWLSRHRDLGFRYFAENSANSLSNQLRAYGIGLLLGLAAVGVVQAANTLMGPFMVIFFGMSLVTVPEAARVLRRSPRHLPLFCLLVAIGLALMGLAWGVVLLVGLPRGLGDLLLGQVWRPVYPLVLPLTISIMGGCVIAGAGAGLHALGAARRSLRSMIFSSVVYVVCCLAGAVTGGAIGTVRGAAAATWIGALMWWWQLRLGIRESSKTYAADGWFRPGRPAGKHRSLPASALMPSPDLTLTMPIPAIRDAAASAPPATTGSSPPSPARPSAGQRSPDRTAARRPLPSGPAQPARRARRPSTVARVSLVTGAVALLTMAAAGGWILTHRPARTQESAGAQARATASAQVSPPASAQAPTTAPAQVPAAATAQALKPVSAVSFDPYGDGQGENSKLAALAIDASPATAWHTDWYTSAHFGALKPGTGLLLDMGHTVTITSVRLVLGSAGGADFQLRVGGTASSLKGLPAVARETGAGGPVRLQLTTPAHGRYVLIWFTKLPPDTSGTFQASVASIRLKGQT
jgi:O-antigen/teichoic acid export membrane protein